MKGTKWIAAGALALAACGSGGDKAAEGNDGAGAAATGAAATGAAAGTAAAAGASSGGTAAASAAPRASGGSGLTLQPGLWETKVTLGTGGTMGNHTGRNCLTPEEASRANAGVFTGKQDKNCKQEGFSFRDGKIAGTMRCSGGDTPGNIVMTMTGTYSATSYEIDQKMAADVSGMKMNIDSHISGHRVGECPAGQTD